MDTTQTDVQQDCNGVGNVYDAQCPCRSILDRVADKWTALIIGVLAQQPTRFNQLRREIHGISPKSLTTTLRALERDGLVQRTVFATVPVTVEYQLTPLGQSLIAPLAALRTWAQEHKQEVTSARAAFDQAEPQPTVAELNTRPWIDHGIQ